MISLIWKYYADPVTVVPSKWIAPVERLVAFPTGVAGNRFAFHILTVIVYVLMIKLLSFLVVGVFVFSVCIGCSMLYFPFSINSLTVL